MSSTTVLMALGFVVILFCFLVSLENIKKLLKYAKELILLYSGFALLASLWMMHDYMQAENIPGSLISSSTIAMAPGVFLMTIFYILVILLFLIFPAIFIVSLRDNSINSVLKHVTARFDNDDTLSQPGLSMKSLFLSIMLPPFLSWIASNLMIQFFSITEGWWFLFLASYILSSIIIHITVFLISTKGLRAFINIVFGAMYGAVLPLFSMAYLSIINKIFHLDSGNACSLLNYLFIATLVLSAIHLFVIICESSESGVVNVLPLVAIILFSAVLIISPVGNILTSLSFVISIPDPKNPKNPTSCIVLHWASTSESGIRSLTSKADAGKSVGVKIPLGTDEVYFTHKWEDVLKSNDLKSDRATPIPTYIIPVSSVERISGCSADSTVPASATNQSEAHPPSAQK